MANLTFSPFEGTLHDLGVSSETLKVNEKRSLDEKGFLLLERFIDPERLIQLRTIYEELCSIEAGTAGSEMHQETGTRRIANLVNKGEVFDSIYIEPKILAAVYHILKGEFILSALSGRDPLSGYGHQSLHADGDKFECSTRNLEEPYYFVNSIWCLDDFTLDNGPTRLVPGSHLISGSAKDYMSDPATSHPDEILLLAPAGSVLIFNAHVWHGGTTNTSGNLRRTIHCYYNSKDKLPLTDQKALIRQETLNRISPAAQKILGL